MGICELTKNYFFFAYDGYMYTESQIIYVILDLTFIFGLTTQINVLKISAVHTWSILILFKSTGMM